MDAGNVSVLWNAPCWLVFIQGPLPSMEDDPKPYRVWISEIMLQQTRVEAVKPYFERFMEAFPTVSHLAQAEDDHLMKMWEGLGYYNRARNLKAAAQMIMSEYGGCLPASFDELIRLPGIGSYTAGAIAPLPMAFRCRPWTAMFSASFPGSWGTGRI